MLALQFATATANLASQNAFLFLATHGPIFIASSSSATLIQCGFQYRRCFSSKDAESVARRRDARKKLR